MTDKATEPVIDLRADVPHSARMYDYYLGGHTNFPSDREAAGRALTVFPAALVAARANRAFMHRSVAALAAAGMDQYLDVGTGIPTSPNLHEIAQQAVPAARVVYADNDPIVLAHAAALLTPRSREGVTAYVPGDVTDPQHILDQAAETLDLTRPVALSLNALLHFVPDKLDAHAIVDHFKAALAPGSTLCLSHLTADFDPPAVARAVDVYHQAGTDVQARTHDEFASFFTGWKLLDPGVTSTPAWRPRPDHSLHGITDKEASCYAAVARKPPAP